MESLIGLVAKLIPDFLKRLWPSLAKDRRAHDTGIFRASDDLLSERHLRDYAEEALTFHCVTVGDGLHLSKFARFFEETGSQYLDKKLQEKSRALVRTLNVFNHFVSMQFFREPSDQPGVTFIEQKMCLQPELKAISRNRPPQPDDPYDALVQQLEERADAAMHAYVEYRQVVAQRLFI